jgi:glycosyltransferase involved in cell wall biosynthesis
MRCADDRRRRDDAPAGRQQHPRERASVRHGEAMTSATPAPEAPASVKPAGEPRRSTTLLSVVVIARNESAHIAACLESILDGVAECGPVDITVIDSDSTDDTAAIASGYPVSVYRYSAERLTAGAARRIGFDLVNGEYVLFIDGDCELEPGWLGPALECLAASPDVAVVYGNRREVFIGVPAGFVTGGPAPSEWVLGGNGLYRSSVLRQVGCFNPFLRANEEAELLGRIRRAGYRELLKPPVMVTHHTLPKDSVRGFVKRWRYGMMKGQGQVLRIAVAEGLFAYHAKRLNRYLLTFLFLAAGVLAIGVGVAGSAPVVPLAWASLGFVAFAYLCYRRRSIRSAVYVTVDWVVAAIDVVRGFMDTPRPIDAFRPTIERIR